MGFSRNQFFSRNSEGDHGMIVSVKFHQNWISSFREKHVQNKSQRTNRHTHGRMTDTGP